MAFTSTRIDGLDHAITQFRRAPHLARQYVGEAVKVTEITTAEKVRRAAPVNTGALRHSIGSKTSGLNASITIEPGVLYGQRPDVYWRFVEFGTRYMAAQPFIRPTAEAEEQPFIGRVADAGKRIERTLSI